MIIDYLKMQLSYFNKKSPLKFSGPGINFLKLVCTKITTIL